MTPPDDKYPPLRFVEDLLPAVAGMRERIIIYEERTNARLNNGAERLVKIDERLEEVMEMASNAKSMAEAAAMPKPVPWSKVIPIVVSLLVTGGGIVWALARNPDRAEFDSSIGEVHQELDVLKNEAGAARIEQVKIRGALEAQVDRATRIEQKLDQLITSDKKRR